MAEIAKLCTYVITGMKFLPHGEGDRDIVGLCMYSTYMMNMIYPSFCKQMCIFNVCFGVKRNCGEMNSPLDVNMADTEL